jgi:hypothetical protein
MAHQAPLIYSKQLLQQAVLRFWWHTTGTRFFVALAIAAIGFSMLVANGDTSWLVGVLGAVLAIGVVMTIAVFVVQYRFALSKLKAMGEPRATLSIDEKSVSFSSGAGSTTLPWSAVSKIIQFETFWLLMYSKSQFSTLPTANLSPEIRAYIIERSRAAGAKVD